MKYFNQESVLVAAGGAAVDVGDRQAEICVLGGVCIIGVGRGRGDLVVPLGLQLVRDEQVAVGLGEILEEEHIGAAVVIDEFLRVAGLAAGIEQPGAGDFRRDAAVRAVRDGVGRRVVRIGLDVLAELLLGGILLQGSLKLGDTLVGGLLAVLVFLVGSILRDVELQGVDGLIVVVVDARELEDIERVVLLKELRLAGLRLGVEPVGGILGDGGRDLALGALVMTETFSSSVLKSETMALAASRAAAMASSDGSVEVVASVLSVLLSDFVSKSEALTA